MSQKEKYNDLISAIKEDEEKKEEQNRFDVTLEQIKEALALLQKLLEAIKEAKGSSVITQKGLDAATKSADNAENGRYPPTQNGDIRSLFLLFILMAVQN